MDDVGHAERPDGEAAREILAKYLNSDVPLHEDELGTSRGDRNRTIKRMIDTTVDASGCG